MGQVVDDMVEGLCCVTCGVYFVKAHGYPVQCKHCRENEPQQHTQPAIYKEL